MFKTFIVGQILDFREKFVLCSLYNAQLVGH